MTTCKTALFSWLAAVALAADARAGQMFPIVTNDAAASCISVACAGSNYLVGIQGDVDNTGGYYTTAQLFGPDAQPVGPRINPVPGDSGGNPRIASSGTNFLMVWPDDNNNRISGQLISASGNLLGGCFAINTNQDGFDPIGFQVLAYGGGVYLAVFSDEDTSGTNSAVYGQLVSASGALIGGNFFIGSPADEQGEVPAVASDGTNFLVVKQFRLATNQYVAYGVFVSPTGAVGAPFAIGQSVSPNEFVNGVIFNGTNYFVVWDYDSESDGASNPYWNIYGRFVTPSGTFPGSEFPIATNGTLLFPIPAFDGANYLMSYGAQFQFLNVGGQPIGPLFTPFSPQGNETPLLSIPIYDGKQFVLVSTLSAGGYSATTNEGIYGAFIPASTTPPSLALTGSLVGSQFPLQITGTPGINYAVLASSNVAALDWTALVTNSPTNGAFSFTDASATNLTRFYRAVKR